MTALAAHAPSVWRPVERDDRRTIVLALGAALTLKVALLLALPLPARPQSPPPPPAGRPTFTLIPLELRPPDLPPPPERPATTAQRRRPVPFVVDPDVAPVVEPATTLPPVDAARGDVDAMLEGVAGPPPLEPVVWYEGDPRVVAPRPLGERARPAYPEIARIVGRGATVVLLIVVDETGVVDSIEVVSAPVTDLGFVAAATEAVARWRYEPGAVGGRPVRVVVRVIVDFALD